MNLRLLPCLLITLLLSACNDAPQEPDQARVSIPTPTVEPAVLPSLPRTKEASSEGTAGAPETAVADEELSDQEDDLSANIGNQIPIQVLDISESNREGKNAIAVTFNTAVDTSNDIQSYFVIHQGNGSPVDGSWIVGKDTRKVWFLNTEPQRSYKVTINPGLPAQNKSELFYSRSEMISTRALKPSVNFDSDGAILPLGYTSGLPVVSVNIAEIDVDFFRIKDKHISDFTDHAKHYGRKGWYAERMSSFGELIYSARFHLNPPKNTRVKRNLDIQQFEQLQKPGLYLAIMRQAGNYEEKEITWFSITDIGLHIRQYKNQMDVHAASLATGKPLRDIELQLIDNQNQVIANNTTTQKGLASFSGHFPNARLLIAKTNKQYTLLNLQQPALDLSEFDLGSRPQLPNELFIYSPRDLYRPGEAAQFSGLLRDHDGRLAQTAVLSADIRNPAGSNVKSFKWQPDKQGYFEYNWAIPSTAPTGRWQLVVSGIMEKPVIYSFNVEEFLPERMKLTLANGDERSVITNKLANIELPILGEYLYGAPAAGNKLGSMVQVSHWREPLEMFKGFSFGNLNDSSFSKQQKLDDILLDKNGQTTLKIPSSWKKTVSPLKVNLIANLFESGGRPITRAHPILIWPEKHLIGIRPHFGNKNPKPGSHAKFDLINASSTGELKAVSNVDVKLIREDRQYFWEYNQHRGWHWNYTEKEFAVVSETLSLDEKQAQTISYPVEWGRYRLEARNSDGNTLTSVRFFAGRDWYYDWKNAKTAAAARPDKINLALDKNAYKSDDVAQLKILPPADGQVLILVESDIPLWSKKISVSTEGTIVDIPINKNWDSHNLYISALLLQPIEKKVKTTPKRALGLIHLPLDREARKLTLDIDSPEKLLPESTLTATLTLDRLTQTNTHVTLAAVDVGVLNITDFKTPDPFEFFFGKRRYSVDSKDIYADVIEANQSNVAQYRFGGDADLVRGGKNPQSEVQIISLFRGPVKFDSNGKAEVKLDIPDFNGRLKLMALAFNDNAYGSGDREVTVAAPIVAEIAMPRFLASGDHSSIALDVQNLTEEPQALTVNLSSEWPLDLASSDRAITLKPKEKTTFHYDVHAVGHEGLATIRAEISGDDIENFSRSWKLGTRPAYPAITQSIHRILKPGEPFDISPSLLADALPGTLQASATLSPAINLHINDQLNNLLAYPYGCLEQTSSRAWPLTFATPENQTRFNLNPIAEASRRDMIQKGIDRILSFQRSNGSFGLWSKDSPEEHWLTVYATDFLLNAKQMGMDVPSKPLKKALDRLNQYLHSSRTFIHQRWSHSPEHYAFATRAYAGYVLSQLNRAPLGALRNLYTRDFDDANSGFSQIQLGLALLKMGDKQSGNQALERALDNFDEEYRYWGDYGSNIRDLGMSIYLLIENKYQSDATLELAIQLQQSVRSRQWLSTQERISLFMAGIALEQNLQTPWKAQWQLTGESPETLHQTQAWSRNLSAEHIQQGFSLHSQHDKPLYLSTLINGYSKVAPKPQSHDIDIERRWYNSKGEAITPSTVKAGDLLLGHLIVTSNRRVPDALVVNLLPAGLELENQNLDNATPMDNFIIDGQTVSKLEEETEFKTREYRDDRFVAALNQHNYRTSHIFFMARAVTPGTYIVPPPIIEDMYRPEIRAIGNSLESMTIVAE